MIKAILFICLISYSFAEVVGQLGNWHDIPSRFRNCSNNGVSVQPYVECNNVYVSQDGSITVEYHFGVRNCKACCVVIPKGNNNKLISSGLDLSHIDLPTQFCPGYYANKTVFNLTYNPNIGEAAYHIKWKLGNQYADTDLILPPLGYVPPPGPAKVSFGVACKQAPVDFLECVNPCEEDGSNVAVPNHPFKKQNRYAVNPIATCGWRNWRNQSVVIIGGGSGLGLSLYKDLKQLGANVKVGGRYTGKRERSVAAYPEIEPEDLIGHNMDVARSYEIQKAWDYTIRNMNLPLIVIYLPGVAGFSPSDFIDKNSMQELLDVNVMGMFKPYELFAQQTGTDDDRSRFHVVVSNSAIQHTPTISPYSISKHAQSGVVEAWINDRLNRKLSGADTRSMVSASYPSAMKTDWSYDDWMAPSALSYLSTQIKVPRDAFSSGTHDNPIVTPASATSSQIIQLLSLPNSIIDALNSSMSIPYALAQDPFYNELFVDMEDQLLSIAVKRSIEEETRFISQSFSGQFAQFVYGQNEQAFGQQQ